MLTFFRLCIVVAVTVTFQAEALSPYAGQLPEAPVSPPQPLQEPYLGVIVAYDQRTFDGVFVPDLLRFPRQFVDFRQDFHIVDKTILPGQRVTFKINKFNEIWDLRLYYQPIFNPAAKPPQYALY